MEIIRSEGRNFSEVIAPQEEEELYTNPHLIFSQVNQYDYSKTEYYPLSTQEFCVQAIGDKIIVKSYFYINCHISLVVKFT
jgi:hypothetical protein